MANGHGGARKGAGRKSTREEYVPDGLITPLMFALSIMRDEKRAPSDRFDACKAALPYCSARLAQIDATVDGDVSIHLVSYLDNDSNPSD